MKILSLTFKKIKYEILCGILLGILAGSLQALLMILFTNSIIHFVKDHISTPLTPLLFLSASFILAQLLSRIILNKLNKKAVFYLQKYLSEYVLNTSYRHFEEEGKSNYYATFTQDIGSITMLINGLPTLLNTCIMALGIGIYLLWYSFNAMLFIFAILAPLLITYFLLDRFILQKYIKQARESWDVWFKTLRVLLDGKKELVLYQELRTKFYVQDIHEVANRCNDLSYKANNAYSYTQTIWSIANYTVLINILVFSESYFVNNSSSLLIFFSLIAYVLGAFISVNSFFPVISKCVVAIRKIDSLTRERTLEDVTSLENNISVLNSQYEVSLDKVEFILKNKSGQNPFYFGPVSFSIKTQESTFVIGKNGSGKSTLVKILSGLYWPDAGHILINNKILDIKKLGHYRSLFAVIFYDFFLFDNLLKYSTIKQREHFYKVLKDLKIDHAVKIVDDCILTEALSDGQRKRLALAAAFLYDRPFMIFDEWASDQDPEFKSYFYNTIIPNLKSAGKGVVVISHDPMFFSTRDNMVNLDV